MNNCFVEHSFVFPFVHFYTKNPQFIPQKKNAVIHTDFCLFFLYFTRVFQKVIHLSTPPTTNTTISILYIIIYVENTHKNGFS